MSEQYPTQPGSPRGTSPPPPPGSQAGWGQPTPSARPWYKRGWFLLLAGFVAGGIVGASGGGDPQAAKTVTVTSVVERRYFTDNCAEIANQTEQLRCERILAGYKEAAATPTTTAPKPAVTKPPAATIEEGEWAVPSEVRPGTYRTTGGGNCYWERLKGFSGQFDDIIANGNPTGPARVTIARTDKGFKTSGCDPWRRVG